MDCTFTGSLVGVMFSGIPTATEKMERTVNRFERNDFSRAFLWDVSFRRSIDLDAQRLPLDDGHILVRDAEKVLKFASARVGHWPEEDLRDAADSGLWLLANMVAGGQKDVFIDTALLSSNVEVRERLVKLLQ